MSSSGLWKQAKPRMAKRSGHAVNEGLEGLSERPTRGHEQPRTRAGAANPSPAASLPAAHRAAGIRTVKVLPTPGVLSTVMVPPWACTMCLTIERPKPVPPSLRLRALSTR